MKGLLLKDFYLIKKYCWWLLAMVAMFVASATMAHDGYGSFFLAYSCVLTGMIPTTLLSYDEREKWSQYSATMPYSRGQLVSVKYIIGIIAVGYALLWSMILNIFSMIDSGDFSLLSLISVATVIPGGLTISTISLPIQFKFGTEKGRMIYAVAIGFICALYVLLSKFGFMSTILAHPLSGAAIILISVAAYSLSWVLSIKVYEKREIS